MSDLPTYQPAILQTRSWLPNVTPLDLNTVLTDQTGRPIASALPNPRFVEQALGELSLGLTHHFRAMVELRDCRDFQIREHFAQMGKAMVTFLHQHDGFTRDDVSRLRMIDPTYNPREYVNGTSR